MCACEGNCGTPTVAQHPPAPFLSSAPAASPVLHHSNPSPTTTHPVPPGPLHITPSHLRAGLPEPPGPLGSRAQGQRHRTSPDSRDPNRRQRRAHGRDPSQPGPGVPSLHERTPASRPDPRPHPASTENPVQRRRNGPLPPLRDGRTPVGRASSPTAGARSEPTDPGGRLFGQQQGPDTLVRRLRQATARERARGSLRLPIPRRRRRRR